MFKLNSFRSSHQRCSVQKGVLRNFKKFTGKHLCQRLFLNKREFLAEQQSRNMSLLKYFNKSEKRSTSNLSDVCESMKSNLPSNISANELEKIQESLKGVQGRGKKKRTVYEEKDKQEIAKYAAVCRATAAIRKFQQRFPHLTKSIVRPWVKSYKTSIQEQKNRGASSVEPKIGKARG